MYGELWIDQEETLEQGRDRVPADLQANFDEFIEKGYTIFRNAVSEETIDQIIADKDKVFDEPEKYVLRSLGKYADPVELEELGRGDRIIDIYGVSRASRDAIAAAPVSRFLKLIFDDDPVGMQSLYFQYGSQQALHQDTAYVVSQKPLSLAACWIALEDIQPGTGELIYYPGSHRFDHFLFSGEYKHWQMKRDGQDQHKAFLQNLHDQANARGIETEAFMAKKGDILIWHADLAHGGSKIADDTKTRMSLVAHFCPRKIKATYAPVIADKYLEYEHANGMYFTCRHYDLAPLQSGADEGALMYDGGVTKRRLETAS